MDFEEEDIQNKPPKKLGITLTKEQSEKIQKIQEKEKQEIQNRQNKKNISEEKQSQFKTLLEERERKYREFGEEYERKELIEVSEEWLKQRKIQQEIPYFYHRYKEEDVVITPAGIKGIHYDVQKKEKKQKKKQKKKGKKVVNTDDHGDQIDVQDVEDEIKTERRMLKSGGRIFDPSKIRILEEEMPPNIRDYIEVPKENMYTRTITIENLNMAIKSFLVLKILILQMVY